MSERSVGGGLFIRMSSVRTGVEDRFRHNVSFAFSELEASVNIGNLHVVADPDRVVAHVEIPNFEFRGPNIVSVVCIRNDVATHSGFPGHR